MSCDAPQTIEEALVAYLNARAKLTAIVGSRIYPLMVEQGANNYPCVTFQVIVDTNVTALDGPGGLATARIQLVAWGRRYFDAVRVRGLLMDALNGFKGMMGATYVQGCIYADGGDMTEEDNLAQPGLKNARVYGKRLDFNISYGEPTPTYA